MNGESALPEGFVARRARRSSPLRRSRRALRAGRNRKCETEEDQQPNQGVGNNSSWSHDVEVYHNHRVSTISVSGWINSVTYAIAAAPLDVWKGCAGFAPSG